eukprot:1109240-Prorocentrum_minimum.AAC.1
MGVGARGVTHSSHLLLALKAQLEHGADHHAEAVVVEVRGNVEELLHLGQAHLQFRAPGGVFNGVLQGGCKGVQRGRTGGCIGGCIGGAHGNDH